MAIVTTDNQHYKNIADAIREKLENEITYTPEQMPSGVSNVFEAGKTNEYNNLWDSLQDFGDRTDYAYAFSSIWNIQSFRPKYSFFPTSSKGMFFNMKSSNDVLLDLTTVNGIQFDFSNSSDISYMFQNNTAINHVGVLDSSMSSSIDYLLDGASNMKRVDRLVLKEDGSQTLVNTFSNASNLSDINFSGRIGETVDMTSCPLTADSAKDVLLHLQNHGVADYEGQLMRIAQDIRENNLDVVCIQAARRGSSDSGYVDVPARLSEETNMPYYHFTEMASPSKNSVRVGSYSIKHGGHLLNTSSGHYDEALLLEQLDKIAENIAVQNLDVIGIQDIEVGVTRTNQLDIPAYLAEKTGMAYYYFSPSIDPYSGGAWGTTILSRYPLQSTETVQLDTQGRENRAYGHVTFKIDGEIFHLFNCHFTTRRDEADTEGLTIRQNQFQTVYNAAKEYNRCIITGSFANNDMQEFDIVKPHFDLAYTEWKKPVTQNYAEGHSTDNILFSKDLHQNGEVNVTGDDEDWDVSNHYLITNELKYNEYGVLTLSKHPITNAIDIELGGVPTATVISTLGKSTIKIGNTEVNFLNAHLNGISDLDTHAEQLAKIVDNAKNGINIIPAYFNYNAFGSDDYKAMIASKNVSIDEYSIAFPTSEFAENRGNILASNNVVLKNVWRYKYNSVTGASSSAKVNFLNCSEYAIDGEDSSLRVGTYHIHKLQHEVYSDKKDTTSITLSTDVWNRLNETYPSPSHDTWQEYVYYTLGWNVE